MARSKYSAAVDVKHTDGTYHEGICEAACAAHGPVERVSVACACLEPHGPCLAVAREAEKAYKALLPAPEVVEDNEE